MRQGIAAWGLAALALAGCGTDVDVGRSAYLGHCTDCHGTGGTGDGPLAPIAGKAVPDLTNLSAAWGGSYPKDYVIRAVGRPSEVHGGIPAMPDFAALLAGEPVIYTLPGGQEIATTDTVLALAAYLETLQR